MLLITLIFFFYIAVPKLFTYHISKFFLKQSLHHNDTIISYGDDNSYCLGDCSDN